ncbi:unnamed protein product [Musa banksii]
MKRLEEKISGRVLNHLLYLMRVGEKAVQRRIALALAHLFCCFANVLVCSNLLRSVICSYHLF